MAVDDAAAALDTPFETDATTVGGYVTAALGRLPVPGDTVTIDGYSFRVERVADRADRLGRRHADHRPTTTEPRRDRRSWFRSRSSRRWPSPTALFVAAEFAIVGAPRANVEHQAAQGSRLAARVARILADPRRHDRYIATTQVGISVGEPRPGHVRRARTGRTHRGMARAARRGRLGRRHALASGIAVGILTYMHIVIGEMVPKGLALQSALRTSLYVSPIIEALEIALLPLVSALNAAGNGLLAVIGVKRTENEAERYHTSEELQLIIEESHERGPPARRVGPHPARAVRVRQPHRGRGDGAARAPGRHSRPARPSTSAQEIIRRHAAHALSRLHRATSITSPAASTSRRCCAHIVAGTPRHAARRAGRCRTCPPRRRSTRCWRRCGARAPTWRW